MSGWLSSCGSFLLNYAFIADYFFRLSSIWVNTLRRYSAAQLSLVISNTLPTCAWEYPPSKALRARAVFMFPDSAVIAGEARMPRQELADTIVCVSASGSFRRYHRSIFGMSLFVVFLPISPLRQLPLWPPSSHPCLPS